MTANSTPSYDLLPLPAPPVAGRSNRHVFSIDVEEWYQVGAYEDVLAPENWPDLPSRVVGQMEQLLDLLASCTTKATLFCLGSVAKRYPRLLKRAVAAGHEIACHGLDHKRLTHMTAAERREDISTAKSMIEDVTGIEVVGYRAPSFSLSPEVWDTYDLLAELGFNYSSSVYPLKTDHYGDATAPRSPYFPTVSRNIIEIPMTVADRWGRRWPAAGGGYFRLMPGWLGRSFFYEGAKQAQSPGMFYMHPWEIDPGQPKVPAAPLKSRFRHSVNQGIMLKKVEKLLRSGNFGPVREIVLPPLLQHLETAE